MVFRFSSMPSSPSGWGSAGAHALLPQYGKGVERHPSPAFAFLTLNLSETGLNSIEKFSSTCIWVCLYPDSFMLLHLLFMYSKYSIKLYNHWGQGRQLWFLSKPSPSISPGTVLCTLSSPDFLCPASLKIRWNGERGLQATHTTRQNGTAQITSTLFGRRNDLSCRFSQIYVTYTATYLRNIPLLVIKKTYIYNNIYIIIHL